MGKQKKEVFETLPDLLTPTEPGHWRLIVDFPGPMAAAVRSESERLGINMQAVVKTLIDDALRARGQLISDHSAKTSR